jgi:PAS domain S-box-containing protein
MDNDQSYEAIRKDYEELQLRVTRFAATEQELINTRDLLDQELVAYKRLQEYTSRSMQVKTDEDLLYLITEAIVDMLEVEGAIVSFKYQSDPEHSIFIAEGFSVDVSVDEFLGQCLQAIGPNKSLNHKLLEGEALSDIPSLREFSSLIISHHAEADLGYELLILAGVSQKNQKSYDSIDYRQINIFNVFVNHVQLVLANRKRNEKIERQVERITRSEIELRKLSLIATKSKSGVIIADSFGRVEWVNEAFTKISGYELHEMVGKKPKEFLQGPATSRAAIDKISKALANKEDIEIVIVNHTKSGKQYYNQLEIISVFDEQGKHINFIAIQKDISDEIQQNQEILKMNSRFEMISKSSSIGIWEWEVSTNNISWNDVMYSIYGLEKSEVIDGLSEEWRNKIISEDKERILSEISRLRSGEIDHVEQEYRIIRKTDLSIRMVKSMTIAERNEEGDLLRLIGSIQDVTDVKNLQRHLEDAIQERDVSLNQMQILKSFYERILKYSPSEIIVLDKELRVNFSNLISDSSPSRWNVPVNMSFKSWTPERQYMDDIVQLLNEAIQSKKLIQSEDHYLSQQGQEKFFLRSIMPYYQPDGALEHVIVMGVDITELKQAQSDVLAKNEELRKINLELDHFVYSISHDLRSPLLSIKGLLGLVIQTKDLSPENLKFLNLSLSSASRLDNTIQEILEYSRNSRLDVASSNIDLTELVRSVYEDLRFSSSYDHDFQLTLVGDEMVYSDKARLGVLLKNIIGNSIKYAKPDARSVIHVKINNDENQFTIEIQDNGEGIAPKHLNKVFDMFYRATTSSIGTGLGLYICKEIVSKLGGTISIHSEQGVGTQLSFSIPKK